MTGDDNGLEFGGIDFGHLRLVDLTRLADQAEPFYRWAEVKFQIATHRGDSLEKIVRSASPAEMQAAILSCYLEVPTASTPRMFDGGGVPYKHRKACFFFFSWLVRDAATQRLAPLISKAVKATGENRIEFEAKILAQLLHSYKDNLRYFEWPIFREVAIQRLEGSRRAKKGSANELFVRTALTEAFSYVYRTRGHYGNCEHFDIMSRPLKVGNRTYDVAAVLKSSSGLERLIVMPVKTRETQGGGHAHLFSRDVEQANQDILAVHPEATIVSVIVAQNWSADEIAIQEEAHGAVFHFNVNPNAFQGFDVASQARLNEIVDKELMR